MLIGNRNMSMSIILDLFHQEKSVFHPRSAAHSCERLRLPQFISFAMPLFFSYLCLGGYTWYNMKLMQRSALHLTRMTCHISVHSVA